MWNSTSWSNGKDQKYKLFPRGLDKILTTSPTMAVKQSGSHETSSSGCEQTVGCYKAKKRIREGSFYVPILCYIPFLGIFSCPSLGTEY